MPHRLVLTALLASLLLGSAVGCATREVNDTVFDRQGVTVYLRQYKKGFTPVGRGFEHPIRISTQRLENILGAIEIRGREEELAGLRAAFEPSELPKVAEGLATGLSKASHNQEVAVRAVRKQLQKVIFDRKYLTSFVAYVENGLLYLHMSRVDWKIPERQTKTKLPLPRVNEHPMKFKVEPWQGMYQEGLYAVGVEWQNPVFQSARERGTDAGRRERVILVEEPEKARTRRQALPADLLPHLTPAQLRQIADLEEARNAGEITEGYYKRELEEILATAREDSATSN